eukprot:Nitzschia sp. Nitz4//scaffold40_size135432//111029//112459//NITZ4_003264-RA/size135432-processed-gene-0.180-mRNA-1//-1//CDS//3329551279//2416//frame0
MSNPTEKLMTKHALDICKDAIRAVDPSQAVKSHFTVPSEDVIKLPTFEIKVGDYDELVVVAFGKASSAMAAAVVQQQIQDGKSLFEKSSGLVICKDDHATQEEMDLLLKHGIQVQMASHPVPDERSHAAAEKLIDLVQQRASPRTLVVCCISGGGSSLFCQPVAPLTLEDLQQTNAVLLASGMGIEDMNVIRKRLETGKGGRLAAKCHPSQLVTLVLSDILGDPLDLIASGPTVPDSSCWKDAWELVERFQLGDKLSEPVMTLLKQGADGYLDDSPTSVHHVFETAQTVLIGNNQLAVDAAARRAQALGYTPIVIGTRVEGEAKEIPNVYTAMAMHLQESTGRAFSFAPTLPVALIAGGETTVSLTPNSGEGGRNQEMALSAALLLDKLRLRNVVFASVGTDGTDGPTDAAGAVVDGSTARHDIQAARDSLTRHDAYNFFDKLGGVLDDPPLIKTGPTGTNVADICVTLVGVAPAP